MQGQTPQMTAEVAQPKPFWPDAPRDIFDYVLSSKGAGLWSHGYGAIVVSLFGESDAGLTTVSSVEQTTGSASAGRSGIVCDRYNGSHADGIIKQIASALADDQQGALTELSSALHHTEESIAAGCPNNVSASLPERLRTMQDRLWTIRVKATSLRPSLQKFYDTLTNEQKVKLEAGPAGSEIANIPSNATAMQCYASAQQAPQWPAAQIARAVRPTKDQQDELATLNETSSQMQQLMMGACPQKEPQAMARLDATLDWIDAMIFASVNLTVALEDFYRSLNDEQRAKLDKVAL